MYTVIQYPFIDLRPAIRGSHRIKCLDWPSPEYNTFIRNFGRVTPAKANSGESTSNPGRFCSCNRAVKFHALQHHTLPVGGKQIVIETIRRSFYSDRWFQNKVEIGLRDNLSYKDITSASSGIELKQIIDHYAKTKISVTKFDKTRKNDLLFKVGKNLSQSYIRATTPSRAISDNIVKWAAHGQTLICMIYPAHKNIRLPAGAKRVQCDHPVFSKLSLHGCLLEIDGLYQRVWLIGIDKTKASSMQEAKNLQSNLLQVHAEKETMRLLLNEIINERLRLEKDSEEARIIEARLQKIAKNLNRKERFNLPQDELLKYGLAGAELFDPGSDQNLENLWTQFNDVYLARNLEKFVDTSRGKVYEAGPMREKTKIVFISSNPVDVENLRVQAEYREVEKGIKASQHRDQVHLIGKHAASFHTLSDTLMEERPAIVHFSGHADSQGLMFEDEKGEVEMISTKALEQIFGLFRSKIKCVVLNACYSEAQASVISGLGMHVVGMSNKIEDEAAITFSVAFYKSLVQDSDPEFAFMFAKAHLLALDEHNSDIPVLWYKGKQIE